MINKMANTTLTTSSFTKMPSQAMTALNALTVINCKVSKTFRVSSAEMKSYTVHLVFSMILLGVSAEPWYTL